MNSQKSRLLPLKPADIDWLKGTIRDVHDFPKPGIVFKDLTTLLKEPKALTYVIDVFAEKFQELKPDYIVGIEARGFILGAALAYKLGVGFIPMRKPGKLPHKVEREEYQLEYGVDSIEIHADAFEKGQKVVLIDDLLATGGTAAAAYNLLKKIHANVIGIGFITELAFLSGKNKLPKDVEIFSILTY